jgi:hypothetical protein
VDPKTRIVTVGGSLAILLFVVELVRRRKLKEEYSVLWVATALVLLVLSIWYGLLVAITHAIGAVLPSSTLFFCGLVFVIVLLLHFSVRISAMERRITSLVQELGLLSLEQRQPLGPEQRRAIDAGAQDATAGAAAPSPEAQAEREREAARTR